MGKKKGRGGFGRLRLKKEKRSRIRRKASRQEELDRKAKKKTSSAIFPSISRLTCARHCRGDRGLAADSTADDAQLPRAKRRERWAMKKETAATTTAAVKRRAAAATMESCR